MDAEETAAWVAIDAGEAQLTWEVWSARVATSQVLSNSGRRVVRRAVDTIAEFLSANWLAKSIEAIRSTPTAKALPFLSTDWWPATDNRRVYERILRFAAQLTLLAGTPGLVPMRRAMRRDLGQFEHGLLQLEVASLAIRDGWSVTFEPKPDPARSRITDLRLTKGGSAMLVEVKGFLLDDWVRNDLRRADKIRMTMLRLEAEHGVHFSGDNGSPYDDAQLEAWLADLKRLAAEVAHSGQPQESTPPFGGHITVRKSPPQSGTRHTMPIRHRDEWQRISDQIDKKADQGRGSDPLWLRFEETAQFWALAAPPEKRQEWVEALAGAAQQHMARHQHVAGLVLSGPARAHSPRTLRESFQLLDGRGYVLSCTTAAQFWRESLLVPGPHATAAEQLASWHDWYLDEASWLDWALSELDAPPLADLFGIRRPT